MTTSHSKLPRLGLLSVVLFLASATPALGGTVTITGTEGRDELQVVLEADPAGRVSLVVTPAATATSTSGQCVARTDSVTGRPVDTQCALSATAANDLVIDLRGGDDVLVVDASSAAVGTIAASGGTGNDDLTLVGRGRTLRGGEGDDVLRAPGGIPDESVTWDGGGGRDLVDFAGATTTGGERTPGVTASLATGRATIVVGGFATLSFRQDTLTGIERLSGTEFGDILEGGAGADELLGQGGPDILRGADGNDTLNGGLATDELSGGKGADTLDGGPGVDNFPAGEGFDTFLTRDGFQEGVTCVNKDVVVNDLADKVFAPTTCLSISTAARKHRLDTRVFGAALRVGVDRALRVQVSCPRLKPDRCAGTLRTLLGRATLATAGYRLRPGRRATLRLLLSPAEAGRVRGRTLSLRADEVDGDGRKRQVLRTASVRR
jgi:hypothetical protein